MKYETKWTKNSEIERNWYTVDVKDQIVGRIASKIASILIGKSKSNIVPNVDGGDYVIVLNSDLIKLTRGKEFKKMYYRHTGFPGGLKEMVFDDLKKKDSRQIVELAVKNMLPKNKLRDGRMNRLFVYKDGEHKHQAQNPQEYKL